MTASVYGSDGHKLVQNTAVFDPKAGDEEYRRELLESGDGVETFDRDIIVAFDRAITECYKLKASPSDGRLGLESSSTRTDVRLMSGLATGGPNLTPCNCKY